MASPSLPTVLFTAFFVAHAGEISEVEEIELDPASETSVNLLRCLFAELQMTPRLVITSTSAITKRRGRLVIGDQAIRFRQKHRSEFHFWDLGDQWKKLVDLPFVYALWLVRPNVVDAGDLATRLRTLRDKNLKHLGDVIDAEKLFDPAFCARYYREHVRFSFGETEKHGLRTFANLCAKNGLVPRCDLSFDLV